MMRWKNCVEIFGCACVVKAIATNLHQASPSLGKNPIKGDVKMILSSVHVLDLTVEFGGVKLDKNLDYHS